MSAATDLIEYPCSDGKPMAETDVHRDWMFRLIELLSRKFAGTQTYVSGNLLIYYVQGDPKKSVAPDVFVVKGVEPGPRDIYKLWEERVAPHFVLEVTSKSTRREDLVGKMKLFAVLGVREYFLFDPRSEYLEPALLGFRLVVGENGSGYMPLEMDATNAIVSEEVAVIFRLEPTGLSLFDAASGEPLKTGLEEAALQRGARERAELAREQAELTRDQAEAALQQERLARQALEAELKQLRETSD